MLKILLFFILLSYAALTSAGDTTGTITSLNTGPVFNNLAFVKMDANSINTASCNTNSKWHYAFEIDTDMGKSLLSMLLAAYASGVTVEIKGSDACSLYNNVEDIRNVILQ